MTIYNDNSSINTNEKKTKAKEIQDNFSTATAEEDVFTVTFDVSDKVSKF